MSKVYPLLREVKILLLRFACFYISVFVGCSDGTDDITAPYIPAELENSTWEIIPDPDAVGWSSAKLREAYEYSKSIQTAAVMIIYREKVLYHWGEVDKKFYIHSCRKSLLSALYGIHIEEGNIDLSKTMGDLGIDDKSPSLTELEKTATVKMLLKGRSGIYHEAALESAEMKADRPERHSHSPGTFWYYNNWDFNALGTIFEQETGKKIFEEFKDRIADPIDMEDFQVSDGRYVYEDVSIHPGYPFRMTARDMARVGLLFLNNGIWKGNRIIAEEWIKESTIAYSDAGGNGGYGYMWWIAVDGRHIPGLNIAEGTYSARGYNGHYILIIPELDLVIVHRVNTDLDDSVSSIQFAMLTGLILDAKVQ